MTEGPGRGGYERTGRGPGWWRFLRHLWRRADGALSAVVAAAALAVVVVSAVGMDWRFVSARDVGLLVAFTLMMVALGIWGIRRVRDPDRPL
jgi:hypothetical protein